MSDYRNERMRRTARGPAQQHRPANAPGNRRLPVWALVLIDVLALGLALNAFALSGMLFSPEESTEILPLPTASVRASANPTQTPPDETATATQDLSSPSPAPDDGTPAPSPTPPPTEDPNIGMWGAKFAGMFTGGDVQLKDEGGELSYKSHDISISITRERSGKVEVIVADIHIRNKDNFQAFFNNDEFRGGGIDSTLNQAKKRNAILAINGDNSGNRGNHLGYDVRNGVASGWQKPWQDVLVMYNDGSMKTFGRSGFEKEWKSIKENGNGAWQVWTFGPMLLDANGKAMTKFAPDSIPGANNQRAAIGYYEPGHYCFVVACGVSSSDRVGLSLEDLSRKMESLGCAVAYNMDGGRSVAMVFNGKNVNTLYEGGRGIQDVVCIGEFN